MFLRASAEANTSDIESDDFLLGIIHLFYALNYAIHECLHFAIQIQKCMIILKIIDRKDKFKQIQNR